MENIELRKFADNDVLKSAVKRFFEEALNQEFKSIKLNHINHDDKKLGELTRSVSQAENMINQVFKEIDKHKFIENKPSKEVNPAR